MRTIERMIDQEVICNVSALVSTIVQAAQRDTSEFAEQALELCSPVQDWESAAMEAGWKAGEDDDNNPGYVSESGDFSSAYSWQELCDDEGIDPHEREIFEHWFVTGWLAERLEAKGERIDRDFAGHCVWGRTTTGQSPEMDSVIEEVYADAKREYEEMFPARAS